MTVSSAVQNTLFPIHCWIQHPTNGQLQLRLPEGVLLQAGTRLYLDFGSKRIGRLHLRTAAAQKTNLTCYAYPHADAEQAMEFSSKNYKHTDYPFAWGTLICPPMRVEIPAGNFLWSDPHTRALRYLRIDVEEQVRLEHIQLEESSWPGPREGDFECSDPAVTRAWQMGCKTVHLCTQPALHSQCPVGRSDQWVIWDGCRRDREIWIGDLRPAALAHYALSSDAQPVRDSLELAAAAAFEDGLIPGSVSSRQVFNEYALWWAVALWEYVFYTGDVCFAREMKPTLVALMRWVEAHVAKSGGLFEVANSWSYTLPRKGLLCAPNMVLAAAYQAAAALLGACGEDGSPYDALASAQRRLVLQKFFDRNHHVFRDSPDSVDDTRIWEDNNAHSILLGIAPREHWSPILSQLKSRLWGHYGAATCDPVFAPDQLGEVFPWAHNATIWPFANAYEVGAWMQAGLIDEGLELLKRFTGACAAMGTDTIWEMIHRDGSIPKSPDNRYLLSLCHSWGATANHYLHRHILGVQPITLGWGKVRIAPSLGSLKWARGTVPTPHGPLRIEVSQGSKGIEHRLIEAPDALEGAIIPISSQP